MRQKLLQSWQKISHIGTNDEMSYLDIMRLKILNQLTVSIIFIILLFIIKTLFEGEEDIYVLFIILVFSSAILPFHYFKMYQPARMYWAIYFPLLLTAATMLYGRGVGANTAFFIFITTSMFLFDNFRNQVLANLFIIVLFLGSMYYTNFYESPYADITDDGDIILMFIITAVGVSTIILTFIQEIRKYIKELENKNNSLSTAYEEIERFSYISSHNLKTPVRTIRSFTDLIERDIKRGKTEHISEYLEYIKQGSEQMQYLINDILEYSKISQDKHIELESVDLNKAMSFIASQAQIGATKPIELQISDLPIIESNRTLINAVFQNLIENAAKYNDKPSVEISVSYKLASKMHVFSFADNGIGIDKVYHDKIFGMFERLHSDPNIVGTGIGLAMSKRIVERLGGSISLISEVGKGSTFFVELPV